MKTSHTIIIFFGLIVIVASFMFVPYKSHFGFVIESKETLERGGVEVIRAVLGITNGKAEISCDADKGEFFCRGEYDTKNLYQTITINNTLTSYTKENNMTIVFDRL